MRLPNDPLAVTGVADVARHHHGAGSFQLTQPGGLGRCVLVDVGARHGRPFPRREHGDGTSIARRRFGIAAAACTGADHEHMTSRESLGHGDPFHTQFASRTSVSSTSGRDARPQSDIVTTSSRRRRSSTRRTPSTPAAASPHTVGLPMPTS